MTNRKPGDVLNLKKAGRAAAKVSPWGGWRGMTKTKTRKKIPPNPRETVTNMPRSGK